MKCEGESGYIVILSEKIKFQGITIIIVLMELSLVLLWGLCLRGFDAAINWIDPNGLYVLLKLLKWFYECSTLSLVVYSSIVHLKWTIEKIGQEHKRLSLASAPRLLDENIKIKPQGNSS
jgi:hypothetical protein